MDDRIRLSPLVCCCLLAFYPTAQTQGGLVLHVAPDGSDRGDGGASAPFRSLERARDEIRAVRRRLGADLGAIEVRVRGGAYSVDQGFRLEAQDSGTESNPVVYRAEGKEAPTFNAGLRLRDWGAVTDAENRERLPEAVRSLVLQVDLGAAGVTNLLPLRLGGFSSGRGFRTHPVHELYVNGEPMVLARWPDEGFVKTGEVPGPLTLSGWDRRPGSPVGRFRFEGDRPLRWVGEVDGWLYGYWYWDWADSYEKIERIDPATREIFLAQPWHGYGYRKDQRYHALNLLCELDQPGEWYLDRTRSRVLVYPRADLSAAVVELSRLAQPLVELEAVEHVRFEGMVWECGAGDGVRVVGGKGCRFVGCTVRRMAGTGVEIRGGREHELLSCDIHTMGRGGIAVTGGDRRTLTPGGHRVENCRVHHLSRIDHTYTPGIWTDGVGQVLRHNLIHDVASSAMRIEGNDHLVELNEAHHVVLESDDQGAVDMFGNPTYRGNVFRHNYWHHLGSWDGHGETAHTQRAGIRLDDAICGVRVEGNIFQRCSTGRTHFGGVQIHGGKENLIEGNLFIDTAAAVSFTPWGARRWQEFTAKSLDSPAIDRELYLTRYPQLRHLADGCDVNTLRSNVTIRCPTRFLRLPGGTLEEGNRDHPQETRLPEGPDGRLVWSDADAAALGLAAIPFGRMGLQTNRWRQGAAEGWALRIPRSSGP